MECREFRKRHVAFVDDLLSADDMAESRQHLLECAVCERHDTNVRRALLVFRNVPRIEPSEDFARRLSAKLASARLATVQAYVPRVAWQAVGAAMVCIVAVGSLAIFGLQRSSRQPVVASVPEASAPVAAASIVAADDIGLTSPLTSSAIAAAMSSGMPAWPAVLMVEQASMHFANSDPFRLASWEK